MNKNGKLQTGVALERDGVGLVTYDQENKMQSGKNALLLGSGVLLPIHWGTFSLAMHPWDQLAEALLEMAPKAGARLVMPHLGEAVEPAHAQAVEPWWRAVDTAPAAQPAAPAPAPARLPKAMSWPID